LEGFPDHNADEKKESIKRFEQMLKSGKIEFMDSHVFTMIVEHYISIADYTKALNASKIAVKQYPYSIELITLLASIYNDTGRTEEAFECISKAEILAPQDSELMLLKGHVLVELERFDEAIETFENLLFFVEEKSEIYYHIGMAYYGKGEGDKAIEKFKLAIQEDTLNEDAFFELVNILDGMDLLEDSIPFYKEFIDNDPYNYKAWYNLGIVYDRIGKYDKAIESYEFCIAIKEDFSHAYFNLGCAFMAKSEFLNAINSFNDTLKHESWKDALVFINIGHCYFELSQFDSSLKNYQKAISLDPESYVPYFGVGRCLEKQEKWLETIHFLQKAAKLYDKDVNVWLMLARAEYEIGNVNAAITALINASELEPEIPEIWLDWSYILSEQGNFQKALEVLEIGIDHLSECASLYYRAVVYLFKSSKYKEAFLYLENALTLNFEKHTELFEFFPELETQKALMKIIDQFSDRDV